MKPILTAAYAIAALQFFSVSAQIYVPQLAPYTIDANTVLLEHFDGSTTGSPNGSFQYASAVFGEGVQLNDTSWIPWALGALPNGTIEFWGKLDNLTNTSGVPDFVWAYLSPSFIGGGPGSTLIVNAVGTDTPEFHSGMPTAGVHDGGSWLHTPTNSMTIQANVWHHYALTWGSAGLRFYVDGSLIGTNGAGGLNPSTSIWLVGNAMATGSTA